MKALDSRKFVLALAAFLAANAWLALGTMTAEQGIGLIEYALGAYVLGNVGEKAVTNWSASK
ncbi:MAG: hypothetical protein AB7O86_12320 [Porticoccaceae bacterium]